MEYKKNKFLLVTPKPIIRENVHGYMLRLCDVNGYKTPSLLLSLAGINIKNHSPYFFNLFKLSLLLGDYGKYLEPIGYFESFDAHSVHPTEINIMGHKINMRFINIKKPKICPKCVEENGYIESIWSVKLITVCSKHKIKLIDKCMSCNKQISQFRPSPLRCQCGVNFNSFQCEIVRDHNLLGLTEILMNLFYNETIDNDMSHRNGFPIKEIESISAKSFCWIIDKLAKIYFSSKVEYSPVMIRNLNLDKNHVMKIVSNILVNWPIGFHKLIDQVRKDYPSDDVKVLLSRFGKLNNFLFRSKLPKSDIEFFRNEYIAYANSNMNAALIDKRLTNLIDEEPFLIGISSVSEEVGIHPKTLHRLIDKGLIDVYSERHGQRRQYIFDRENINLTKANKQEYISERDAAKYLGIPVSVLKELRFRKIYKQNNIGNKISSYTKKDIVNLKCKIRLDIKPISKNKYNSTEHILLTEVMRMKLGSPAEKTNFICEFMDRVISPVGIIGYDLARIVFDRKYVHEHLNVVKLKNVKGKFVIDAEKHLH